jgi:two-component system sensor histidine kinase YesM
MKWNSLYARLLFCFFVLMIPLQLLGAVLIWSNNNTLRRSNAEIISGDLRQLTHSLSGAINSVSRQIYALLNERDFTLRGFPIRSPDMTTGEYNWELSRIHSRMEFISLSNNLIDDMQLVYPTLGICLSVRWGISYISGAYDYITRIQLLTLAYDKDREMLCVGRMYPSLSYTMVDEVPSSILQATLSKNAIRSMLAQCAYPEYPAAFIYHRAQQVYTNAAGEGMASALLTLTPSQRQIVLNGRSHSIFTDTDESLGYAIIRLLPDEVFYGTTRMYIRLLVLYCFLTIPAMLLYMMFIRRLVMRPVILLEGAFRRMKGGEFDFSLSVDTPAMEFRQLINGFNTMIHRIDELIHRIYKQEIYTRQIELKQLQAQINPHFLYNAFFILRHMLKNDDFAPAMSLAHYLGEYFHYLTRSARTEIPLADEYRHMTNYIYIQHLRYAKHLNTYISQLPSEIEDMLVPRLILQPLIENAFNYAIAGDGEVLLLKLSFEINNRDLYIIVEDNGLSLSDEEIDVLTERLHTDQAFNETTGMINIHKRLKLYFGADFGLALSRSALGGLRIVMKLPRPGP